MIQLRFVLMTLVLSLTVVFMALGGAWLWAGFGVAFLLSTAIDEAVGDELRAEDGGTHPLFDALLYATLPLLLASTILYLHLFADGDPLGLAAPIRGWFGIDLIAARAETTGFHLVGGALTLGLLFGGGAVNVAHELVHRVHSPRDLIVGRWLLGLTFDTGFAIEHVYGHHRHVGTDRDPATARRGEYVLAFALRTTIGQIASAWRIEAQRLANRGLPAVSHHNRFLRGQLMSLAYLAGAYAIAGVPGMVMLFVLGAQGKLYLECTDYIEHYGLVRVPGTPIAARHSWDSYRLVTGGMLYNLPRHSDHHLRVDKRFWELAPRDGAPRLPHGYEIMILLALAGPPYRRIMAPRLADWDDNYASPAERALIAERGWNMPAAPAAA